MLIKVLQIYMERVTFSFHFAQTDDTSTCLLDYTPMALNTRHFLFSISNIRNVGNPFI